MDLTNATTKRNSPLQRLQKPRSPSYDDDDLLSHNSSSSFNALFAAASDMETQSPVSVRDMIKRYDTVAKLSNKGGSALSSPLHQQQQHNLSAMKSAYFGMNKFGTPSATTTIPTNRFPLRQYVARMQEDMANNKSMQRKANNHTNSIDHSNNNNNKTKSNLKLSANSLIMKNKKADFVVSDDGGMSRGRHGSVSDSENIYVADYTRFPSRSLSNCLNGALSNLQSLDTTDMSTADTTEGIEEAHLQPMETSYQSKTTIAKTAGGVRIIIDIFFDQEHQPVSATDVVGSRVETDIPQSRILNEFQQQAAAAQLTNN